MAQENAKAALQPWRSETVAKWVLNYRAHNVQHINPTGKEWEHIVEESTGGANSADNLALADADLNQRLGTYYGTVRTYPELVLDDITEPVILREYLRGKPATVQRRWKLKVYASSDFRVALSWQNQGRGQDQVLK